MDPIKVGKYKGSEIESLRLENTDTGQRVWIFFKADKYGNQKSIFAIVKRNVDNWDSKV